jgi:hypothetical protein
LIRDHLLRRRKRLLKYELAHRYFLDPRGFRNEFLLDRRRANAEP